MRWWFIAAFAWGFAEATVFFIVPDLLLTASIVMLGFMRGIRLAGVSAIGAVIGGLVMYWWGAQDVEAALGLVRSVPLIADDLLVRVAGEMRTDHWPINLFMGALTGAPFKIYAVEAGNLAINPVFFALAAFGARLARFMLAIGLTAIGVAVARRLGLARLVPYGLAAVWAGIYGFYVYVRLSA